MAVTLEEFKKQFEAIKKKVVSYAEEIGKNERYMGQTTGVIQEGTKEVGLRVQELKDKGVTGATIDAFMKDAEVNKMVTAIKQYLAGMQKEILKAALMQNEIRTTVSAFQGLKTKIAAEIAERKKAVSTKVGTGNKSLPDMEKLLAEVKKYGDEVPYVKVEAYQCEKYEEHLNETNAALTKEVTQSKAAALTTFQKQMQEQALNVRVLGGNVTTAKGWYAAVAKECVDGQKALAARKQKELMTAKANVVAPWKKLHDMHAMYQDALKDTWISAGLKTSKDKSTIEANIKLIADMVAKAGPEVTKIANAKL